jgi:4-amino-4-deoxy-L-arabinose transferase-like glycosyltransferase
MRTVDELEVSYAQADQPGIGIRPGLFDRLARKKVLIGIIAVAALAFCARVYRLDAAGFAEDETNKIFAIRAYRQGDFTANAEHPMVMKLLCYASVSAAASWNRAIRDIGAPEISEETALRLPNALFGALTVIPLFLFASSLLGRRVGFVAAVLWGVGLDAIWVNRIAKEDTLLVFFMYTGFWLYKRAKDRPASDIRAQELYYCLAGAAFGLMMASKYTPHHFGLFVLFFYLVSYDSRNNRPIPLNLNLKFFATMMLTFFVVNPAVILPQTWRYLWKYVNEELITHHGYLVAGTLYNNDAAQTPVGTPWYTYLLFLAVKVPVPVLIAFIVGLVEIFRHRGTYPESRGYLFLRLMLIFWLFPMSLTGGKFLRYTLTLMPLFYMISAVGIIEIWRVGTSLIRRTRLNGFAARRVAAVTAALLFVIAPGVIAARSLIHSHPSLYVNPIGDRQVGYFFPHDEFYDLGARESIKYIADNAPSGARLASEIPGVVEYYLERYNRSDIHSEIISKPGFSLEADAPEFVMLQRGRLYFENQAIFELIEKNYPLAQASTFEGAAATQVYVLQK